MRFGEQRGVLPAGKCQVVAVQFGGPPLPPQAFTDGVEPGCVQAGECLALPQFQCSAEQRQCAGVVIGCRAWPMR